MNIHNFVSLRKEESNWIGNFKRKTDIKASTFYADLELIDMTTMKENIYSCWL